MVEVLATSLLQHLYTVFNISQLDSMPVMAGQVKATFARDNPATVLLSKVFRQGWPAQRGGAGI